MDKEINKNKESERGSKFMKIINDFFINYFDWLILFIGLCIIAAGYFMIIKPKYEIVIEDIQLVSSEKEREYTVRNAYLNNINNFKKAYKNISDQDVEKIDKLFYKKNEIEELFSEVETLIKKSGLILNSLGFELLDAEESDNKKKNKTESEDDFQENIGRIKISIEITGTDYSGFEKLLREIEGSLRLMDVENINFSHDGMKSSLDILAYYYEEN
ncbi:MAG: hypothetical protein ABIA02_03400 [Candidatus Falkowbacteria bacterium]